MTGFPCPVCRQDIPGRAQWPDLLLCPHCQQPVSVPPSLLTPAAPATAAFAPGEPAPVPATLADARTLSVGPGGLPAELIDFLGPPQAPDEVGRLGGYRVLKVLGSGGMGVVYQAEDAQLQRLVALKVMLPTLAASPSARQRFLREARAAARLKHDHVVAIYHVAEERGLPFLTMELLEGESLEECLQRRGKLPVAEALRVGREVAEGLAAAHERGLVHRDIKPANVWLEEGRDRVKIVDFGLARAAGDTSQLTQQGAVMGTPAYMAPEQARGEGVDHRCDLFSLGCVLYRMTTGTTPFKGSDAISTLMAVCTEQPPPPRERNPEVPPALSDLIMRMLEKEAGKRPDSARAVAEALATLPPEEKGLPPAPSPEAKRLRGRRKLLAAVLLLLAAAGVGVFFLAGRGGRRGGPPPGSLDRLDPVLIPAHERLPGQPNELVAVLRLSSGAGALAFAPDGQTLAVACPDGNLWLWDLGGTEPVAREVLRGPAGDVQALAFAPDGQALASGHWDGTVRLWHLAGLPGQPRMEEAEHEGPVLAVAFTPDGRGLVTGAEQDVRLWDLFASPLKRRHRFPLPGPTPVALALSTDGRKLAAGAKDGKVRVWDLSPAGLGPPGELEGHTGQVQTLAFARGGRALASGGVDDTVRLWDVAGPAGKDHEVLWGHTSDVLKTAFSPDGDLLVSLDHDQRVILWNALTSRKLREWKVDAVPAVAFAPDGRHLAIGTDDGTVYILRLSLPHEPPEDARTAPGFESLFNGKDLSGWKVVDGKPDNWKVDPDRKTIVTLGGDQSWLLTEKEYADFELRLECRVMPRGNSGVALRTSAGPFPGGKLTQGMEVQVADDRWHRAMHKRYGPKNFTGGIFDLVAPSSEAARPVGEWNALRITATGARVRVELNGIRVVDEDLGKFEGKAPDHPGLLAPRGHVGLQSFQGRAEFRRIAVRPR